MHAALSTRLYMNNSASVINWQTERMKDYICVFTSLKISTGCPHIYYLKVFFKVENFMYPNISLNAAEFSIPLVIKTLSSILVTFELFPCFHLSFSPCLKLHSPVTFISSANHIIDGIILSSSSPSSISTLILISLPNQPLTNNNPISIIFILLASSPSFSLSISLRTHHSLSLS